MGAVHAVGIVPGKYAEKEVLARFTITTTASVRTNGYGVSEIRGYGAAYFIF